MLKVRQVPGQDQVVRIEQAIDVAWLPTLVSLAMLEPTIEQVSTPEAVGCTVAVRTIGSVVYERTVKFASADLALVDHIIAFRLEVGHIITSRLAADHIITLGLAIGLGRMNIDLVHTINQEESAELL